MTESTTVEYVNERGDVKRTAKRLEKFMAARGYRPVVTKDRIVAAAAELKGKDLDAALEEAGLPKTGTADEKRAALVDYVEAEIGRGVAAVSTHEVPDDEHGDPEDPSQNS